MISMASLIKGISIILYARAQVGVDAFNSPVYEESPVQIDNVLVCPVDADSITGESQMNGKRLEYELCIPKGDLNIWEDRIVEFWGRKWRTIGFPREWIEENVPLDWNRKVTVECYG